MTEPNPYHPDTSAATPECPEGKVVVLIENSYEDGHECAAAFVLPAPEGKLEPWWDVWVHDETGCGHGVSLDAIYTATITSADPANAHLVGESKEWGG